MSYTPINTAVYTSAFSGGIAGMAVSGWITDATTNDYADVVIIAGAFAQSFDQIWNSATQLDNLELAAITQIVQTDFNGRGPGPFANPQLQNPGNWDVAARACVALVLESDIFFASQGINPGTNASISATADAIVWVSKGGSDTVGDGTDEQPFLTITRAMASILDATVSKRYTLMLAPGIYTENVLLKPNVFIVGVQGNICRINGTLDLDPSWAGPANNRSGIDNCVVLGIATIDLVAVNAPNSTILGQFSFFNNDVIFRCDNGFISLQQPYFGGNVTINGGFVILEQFAHDNYGQFNINALPASPIIVYLESGMSNGFFTVTADPASGGVLLFNFGCDLTQTQSLTLDGTGVSVFSGPSMLRPNIVLVNGALAPVNAEIILQFTFATTTAIINGINTFPMNLNTFGVADNTWSIEWTLFDNGGTLTTCTVTAYFGNGTGTLRIDNPGLGFALASDVFVTIAARKVM